MVQKNILKGEGTLPMEIFFYQKITILVSIPRFLIASIPNPVESSDPSIVFGYCLFVRAVEKLGVLW